MAHDKREQDLGHDGLVLWKPFVEASRKIWGSLFDQSSDEVRSHLYDLFKAGHAAATAEAQADGWVDVADRLPEYGGEYLVTVCVGYVDLEEVRVSTWYGGSESWKYEPQGEVIAWQPLPQPYQRQSSEGE